MAKININSKEWEFEFQQRNEQPILAADLMGRGFYYGLKKEIRLPIPSTDFLFTATGKGYVKKKQEKIILDSLRKAINRESYLKYIFDTTKKRVYEFENLAKRLTKKIKKSNLAPEDIALLWKEFDKVFLKVYPWFCIPWYVTEENMLSNKAKLGLARHKDAVQKFTDLNNALLVLIFPTKQFLLQKEQARFYELVKFAERHKNFEKNKDFIRMANDYLKKYSWINTFFILPIEPLALDQLLSRVRSAIKEKFTEQYSRQKSISAKNKKLASSLIRALHSDKDLLKSITWSRKYAWLLNWSVEQALVTCAGMQPFFKLIAKRIGTPYRDWIHLTSGEILDGLRGKRKFSRVLIKKRERGFVFLIEEGKTTFLYGSSAKKTSDWLDKNIDAVDTKIITEIKGQSASSGLAKGRVCVVMITKEANKVREGDVLVCSMTSPDYVPAMNRAVAIIADEGGLLSHAAIVSRELGKPCIVGTKIATKILKTGDFVEVDANKGIVRILKHG